MPFAINHLFAMSSSHTHHQKVARIRRWFLPIPGLFLLLIGLFYFPGVGTLAAEGLEGANIDSPIETVERATIRLIDEVLRREQASDEQLRPLLYQTLDQNWNLEYVSRKIFGKNWAQTNQQKRQAFIKSLREVMIFYALKARPYIRNFEATSTMIESKSERIRWVKTSVRVPGLNDFPIYWRLRKSQGAPAWQIVDMRIFGFRLVTLLKGQLEKLSDAPVEAATKFLQQHLARKQQPKND